MRRPGALGAPVVAVVLCLGPPAGGAAQPAPPPAIEYVDVAGRRVDFRHVTGASGRRYFPETMGSGVGFVDSLRIHWPGGAVEGLAGLQPDRFVTLVEGEVGRPAPATGP